MAVEGGIWAGAPVPIEAAELVVEKRYPYQHLNGMTLKSLRRKGCDEPEPADTSKLVNHWASMRREVLIVEDTDADGKVIREKYILPVDRSGASVTAVLNCIDVAMHAWSVEAEYKALSLLQTLIKPHLFDAYLLTGAFMETSKRSGVMYVFRKLKPTLALTSKKRGGMSVLCGLCLHPLGYYQGTYAGCLVPTDDVIAHLLMMRGDEHKFWGMANQFNPANHGLSYFD